MSIPFTRILVPTDFSELSGVALEFGQALAERCGASLHVLHVVDDPFAAGPISSEIYVADVPAMRGALVTEAETRLAGLLPESVRNAQLTSEVQVGSPASMICEVAARTPCDLIVMGTHGRSGVAHLFLGSVAEKVVRAAPCPVLTVRGHARARKHVFEAVSQASLEPSTVA